MMKIINIFLVGIFVPMFSLAGGENYILLKDALKDPENVKHLEVNCDSISFVQLKERIKDFSHLSGIAFKGEPNEEAKIWDALSHLRMLEQLLFIDNNLSEIKLGGSSSTLKTLWVKGSPHVNGQSINNALNRANYIQYLRLDSIYSDVYPYEISNLEILKELQISHSTWKSKPLFAIAGRCEKLKRLDFHSNNFQFIGNEIKRVDHVNYLDVSGNALSKLPKSVVKLNKVDTLIMNRNGFNQLTSLANKLKSMRLNHLILDIDSTLSTEEFEYRLPGMTIDWNNSTLDHYAFNLPHHINTSKRSKHEVEVIQLQNLSFKSTGASNLKLNSPAYIIYDNVAMPNPLKDFDTITFKARFKSKDYEVTDKIIVQNHTPQGKYHPLKWNKKTGLWDKKKELRKIKHKKHSPIQIKIEEPPKDFDGLLLFKVESKKTDVLKNYARCVWEAVEYGSGNDHFKNQFIKHKSWSDVRLYKEEGEEGIHRLVFKGRFQDDSVQVIPRDYTKLGDDKFNEKHINKTIPKLFKKYEKNLVKIEKKFNKNLARAMKKAQRKDIRRINALWKQVEAKMTDEEKEMTRPDWVRYYRKILENEYPLLAKEKFQVIYLARFLCSQGFKESKGQDFFVGQKWKSITLLNPDSSSKKIKDYCLIDLDRRLVKYYEADSVNKILVEPFHNYQFIAQLKSGQVVVLNPDQTKELLTNEQYLIEPKNWATSGLSNAAFFRNYILKEVNKLVY